MFVCALFGGAWPVVWVVFARAGALAAVVLGGLLARKVAGGRWQVAGLAAGGVLLTGGFLSLSAQGSSEGLLLAFAFGGVLALLDGRSRLAVACFVACALLRVETWPFLVALAWWHGWRWRLAGTGAAVLALWFVPEWVGSGELLRSADRARVPNPGVEPGFAESIADAAALTFWPLAIFAFLGPRLIAAAGAAWIVLVAVMAEIGFSGEWRYALPGAAALAVAGAAGIATRPRLIAVAAVPMLVVAAVRVADWPAIRDRETFRADQVAALNRIVDDAPRCGTPYVGRFRGTLLAYALDVEKQRIDFVPRAPGVVYRSRLDAGSPPSPPVPPGFEAGAANAHWSVHGTCVRQP